MSDAQTIMSTDLGDLKVFRKGKVREVYELPGAETLLMVATDRISAYDSVLPQGIPLKGRILTQISVFWFQKTSSIIANHLVEHRFSGFPEMLQRYRGVLEGRSIIIRKTRPYPIECIVRGYLSGSGWAEYCDRGSVCSIPLPANLKESEKLPEPIFTPSTKATEGHDINISFEEMVKIVGEEDAINLRKKSLDVYKYVTGYAEKQGIIIADTKFEFGEYGGEPILIDEIFTPDSSRFWEIEQYEPGRPQKSLDKQYVRDYLNSVGWDRSPPAPDLPAEVIAMTTEKYRNVYKKLTGTEIT